MSSKQISYLEISFDGNLEERRLDEQLTVDEPAEFAGLDQEVSIRENNSAIRQSGRR